MPTLGFSTAPAVVTPRYDSVSVEQARLLNAARARLLESATAITTAQFAKGADITEAAARGRIKRYRSARKLITVAHDGEALVPTFQLAPDFRVATLGARVVGELVAAGLGPWAIWDWAETPNGWLDGATPGEVIRRGGAEEIERALRGLLAA